jgi:hypothetical protein
MPRFGKQTQLGWPGPGGSEPGGRGVLYKQIQFRRVATRRAVQTNPICPRRMGRRGRGWNLLRQTNPIPVVAAFGSPHYSSIPSFHHSNPMAILLNKANSASRPGVSRAECDKQSRTSASWGIWGSGGSSRAILPNKANSPIRPAASAGHLYKQSQFPPRCQDRQGLGRKGVMVNSTSDRPRQNKANLGEV